MEDFGLSKIENIWDREKKNRDLTDLPESFYEKAANYANELQKGIRDSRNIKRSLLKGELEKIIFIIQEIYLLRLLKASGDLFLEKEEKMLEKEKRTFNKIRDELNKLRKELVEPAIETETKLKIPKERKNSVIVTLSAISEPITASDLNFYGPFKESEIANIPKKSAELLVNQGLARKLKIEKSEYA